MKMNMSILLATSLIASGYAIADAGAWQVPSWDARLTESGAVQGMTGETWCGHVQGMCATSNALYFAFHNQILKTDWYGRFLKRVVTFAELKDGKFTDISRYGVFDKQIER